MYRSDNFWLLSFFFFLDQVKVISEVGSKQVSEFVAKMSYGDDRTGMGRTGTELYVTIPTKGKGS